MRGWSQRRRLGCVLGLNLLMIAALVFAGVSAHSLGVLAAAGDFAAETSTRGQCYSTPSLTRLRLQLWQSQAPSSP